MKQADLVVGNDYAYSTFGRADDRYAARVTILAIPRAGKVDVKVVDPGRKPHWQRKASFKKGQKAQITTASIVCPWDEYAALVEARDLAEAAAEAGYERREEEHRAATRPDPDRPVESDYEPAYEWDPLGEDPGRAELADKLNASLNYTYRSVAPAEAVALLGDLPPKVRRDLIAALQDAPFRRPYGESQPASAAVRDVFGRAASVARQVVNSPRSGRDFESPDALLRAYDADFLDAIADLATAQGQEFTPPFVPRLPAWITASWRTQSSPVLAALGWVRVALADTSGSKLHRLGCSTTRSREFENLRTVPTMAWWEMALTPSGRLCGVCGGPAILHGVELAQFLAAADVWEARGRDRIESWQIAAVGRLIAATTSTRMREGQFDATLSARVWDALSADAPGEEGWNAYHLVKGMTSMWHRTKDLTPEQSDTARALAVRRLNQLLPVLPESQRLIELPSSADLALVAERYQVLSEAHKERITELDRALFSLEGAMVN